MPRKKNRRKEIQKARRQAEQPKQKPMRTIMIDPAHSAGRGAALALLAASLVKTHNHE